MAGARKGKGEKKSRARAREAVSGVGEGGEQRPPLPLSLAPCVSRAPNFPLSLPLSLPLSSACHAGYFEDNIEQMIF